MSDTSTGARVALAAEGTANVTTGLPVLDHLVTELARSGRFRLTLEVAPGGPDHAVGEAGRAFGSAIAERLASAGAAGRGWAIVAADEALALAAIERADESRFVTNVDFSDQRVGGLGTDVPSRFLHELSEAAELNLHVRLVEGTDPQHVLAAIFKSVGAALGQACRPIPDAKEEPS
jgi:imidazoleglycerol-phosphate dehydratase